MTNKTPPSSDPISPQLFPPSAHKSTLKVYCDGGSRGNPGPAAAGYVVKSDDGSIIHSSGKYVGITTNNVAEYQSAYQAIKWIVDHHLKQSLSTDNPSIKLDLFMDSKLVVNQLSGNFKIKQSHLKEQADQIHRLISQNKLIVTYHHIPRQKNQAADAQVNHVLDNLQSTSK